MRNERTEVNVKEVWETFLNSGLPGAKWESKTYAVFKLQVEHERNAVKVVENNGGHAEEHYINVIRENLNFNREKTIMLYINYSPCHDCVLRLRAFLENERQINLKIAFVKLYRTDDCDNEKGLRELRGIKNVKHIGVFTLERYNELKALLEERGREIVEEDEINLAEPPQERHKEDERQNFFLNKILSQ